MNAKELQVIKEKAERLAHYGDMSGAVLENVIYPLISTIEAQAKELERLRTEVEAYEIASLPAERREIENEQLRKELNRKSLLLEHALELIEDREKEIEEMELECDVHKEAMGIANQTFVEREDEIEQLRNQLKVAVEAMKSINKNIMNRYVIRAIVTDFLSHFQGKENTTNE